MAAVVAAAHWLSTKQNYIPLLCNKRLRLRRIDGSKHVLPEFTRSACEAEETEVNEFEKLDSALHSLIYQKTCKSDNKGPLENVQQQLKDLDLCNQELEEGLENLYRRLIKTRVSLLNTFVN